MVLSINGSYKVKYQPDGEEGEVVELDFTPPFKRLRMFPALEEALGAKLPNPTELDTQQAQASLSDLCTKNEVECPPPRTSARLLDKVGYHSILGLD